MKVRFFSSSDHEGLDDQKAAMLAIWAKCPVCGDFDPEDLFDMVRNGKAVIGAVYQDNELILAGAFEFVHYPRQLAVNIMAIAGQQMDAAMDAFWETFRQWCRSAGADVIEARCAPGMTRLLQRKGFEPAYTVVRQKMEV
jgi:hypothetical protein